MSGKKFSGEHWRELGEYVGYELNASPEVAKKIFLAAAAEHLTEGDTQVATHVRHFLLAFENNPAARELKPFARGVRSTIHEGLMLMLFADNLEFFDAIRKR